MCVAQMDSEACQARDQHDMQRSFRDIAELRVLVGLDLGMPRIRAGANDRNSCAGLVFPELDDGLRRGQRRKTQSEAQNDRLAAEQGGESVYPRTFLRGAQNPESAAAIVYDTA